MAIENIGFNILGRIFMQLNDHVRLLLEDLTVFSNYEFLEEGKNDEELNEIAAKRGLKIPSRDLSIFKCKYAMVDSQNRNRCTLPRKEVKKALKTLIGKAVDKDHLRQVTVGFWLDSDLDGDEIIAYGAFWKSNFSKDYDEIKKRMLEGKVKISFEAWGDRIFNTDGSYELNNIEFAGGALLFDTQPAFPDAEIMEFSQYKDKILEFAKVIGTEEEIQKNMEESRLHFNWDNETIARLMTEAACPTCDNKGWFDVLSIDFENSLIKGKCAGCSGIAEIKLTPSVTIIKKGKKPEKANFEDYEQTEEEIEMVYTSQLEGEDFIDEDGTKIEEAKKLTYKERKNINDDMFAVVVTVKNKKTGEPRKIRMFPIHDEVHVRNALARLPQATETLKKLGVSPDTVKNKILKRAKELNMTELLKRHKEGGNEMNEIVINEVELLQEKPEDVEVSALPAEVLSRVKELVKEGKPMKEAMKQAWDEYKKANPKKASTEDEIKILKDQIVQKDQEIATLTTERDALKVEKETLIKSFDETKLLLENAKLELEKFRVDAKKIEDELNAKKEAEKASFIQGRRLEIGDWGKELTDEDISNDLKFENAKLKKELDVAKGNKQPTATAGLEAGAQIKEKDTQAYTKQKTIQGQAFPDTTQ
jgi:hypothetical protein